KNWRNVPVSPPPSQEISLQGKTVVSELGCHHKLSLLDASALTSQYSRPNGRITNVTSRYWQYRLHAPLREPGDVDDAGACFLLRRTRRTKERPRHHDAKLCLDGLDHGPLVGLRILGLFVGRSHKRHGCFWHHRPFRLGGP